MRTLVRRISPKELMSVKSSDRYSVEVGPFRVTLNMHRRAVEVTDQYTREYREVFIPSGALQTFQIELYSGGVILRDDPITGDLIVEAHYQPRLYETSPGPGKRPLNKSLLLL